MYKDKGKQREYTKKWVAKRRSDFYKGKKCSECGSTTGLELHHSAPSKKESHRIWSWKKERRDTEIKKCVVLCSNCHKKETARIKRLKIKHGGIGMYEYCGCRCELCKKAKAIKNKKYRKTTTNN